MSIRAYTKVRINYVKKRDIYYFIEIKNNERRVFRY